MATLQILGEESYCPLTMSQMGIGREADNEIVIHDDTVSGYHALITIRPAAGNKDKYEYIIEDLDSTNQTFVNSREISQHTLKDGDIIRVGNTRLKFSIKDYVPPNNKFQATQKIKKI